MGYRNSFRPEIKGNIKEGFPGTIIDVQMSLSPFVMVFMFIWLGGVGMTCVAILIDSLSSGNFEPMVIVPFGMLILGYVLVTAGFKYESTESKKYFAKLFEAEMEG